MTYVVAGRYKTVIGGSADPSMYEAPSNDKMSGDHAPKPTPIPVAGNPTTGNASRQVTRDEGATTSSSDLSSRGSASEMSPEISVKKRIDQFEKISKRANASTTAPKLTPPPVEGVTGNEEATTSTLDISSQGSASEMSPNMSVRKMVAKYNHGGMSTEEPQETPPNNGETSSGNNSEETPVTSAEPADSKTIFQTCITAIEKALSSLIELAKGCVSAFYRKLTSLRKGSESTDDNATSSSEGSESTDDKGSRFFSMLNSIKEACIDLESGLIFVIDGELCIWDLEKLWEQRKERELTTKEFLKKVCQMATEALFEKGFKTVGQSVGKEVGKMAATSLTKGAGPGSIIAGMLGAFVGGFVGGIVGVCGSWLLGKLIEKLDESAKMYKKRVVIKISVLKPGDQVILPDDDASHLPSHAIIVEVLETSNEMSLIRNKSGSVVKETVHFDSPIERVEFNSNECRPPAEVVTIASKYIDKEFPQNSRDGREFAMMCKLTCIHELPVND